MFDHWLPKHQQKTIAYFQANPINPQTSGLLPVRPRPRNDELLSSWLVRLATQNGVSPSCFANEVLSIADLKLLGTIDTWKIPSFLERLGTLTGIPIRSLRQRTFYHLDFFWSIPGIAPINGSPTYARMEFYKRHGSEPKGLRRHGAYRACIQCWREDAAPYVRSKWRYRFTTTCAKHKVILIDSCARCSSRLNSSFSRSLARANYFHHELSVCRHCGNDLRYQDQPLPHFNYEDGSLMTKFCTLDPYLEVEEIFQRSYNRGWFSLADAERLLGGPTPHFCPWDPHSIWNGPPIYPEISEHDVHPWSGNRGAEDFQQAFNAWIAAEFSE